jgi:NAD-dependent dihydropyrimidine dehydrogenase PreA subunit
MIREIVRIDEDKCDGCGLCIPNCHEGALQIVDGKARLVADNLCDGLGACLGHCPRDAITVERRQADEFDEQAVAEHVAHGAPQHHAHHGGCPGSRLMQFDRPAPSAGCACAATAEQAESELTHWPVKLRLLPPNAPVLRGAALLVAADCVPLALPDFHTRLLRGRAIVAGCPKFDELDAYIDKLTAMITAAELHEIVVARMEVPCCTGIVTAVVQARQRARSNVTVREIIVSTRGEILADRTVD